MITRRQVVAGRKKKRPCGAPRLGGETAAVAPYFFRRRYNFLDTMFFFLVSNLRNSFALGVKGVEMACCLKGGMDC